ncbi:uncharacterized protein LOC144623723 isoform X2 [Crassostrea virginica]
MTGMLFVFYCNWAVLLCLSVQAYENLALKKIAWQSSTWTSYTADLAVDGRETNLSLYGGQCAASGWGRTQAEWWVDLGGVRSIYQIVIQFGTKDMREKDDVYIMAILGFSVYISNTTNKIDGVLCFRDTNYTRTTVPIPFNISCPYHGRYVIYYNNRTHPPYPDGYSKYAWIKLCEVKVFDFPLSGCPSPGYYCSLECPQNCQDGCCGILEGNYFTVGIPGLRSKNQRRNIRVNGSCIKTQSMCEQGFVVFKLACLSFLRSPFQMSGILL